MNFELSDVQASWKSKGRSLARELRSDASAADVVMGAARFGLLDSTADLLSAVVAVDAMASESVSAAAAFALHTVATLAVAGQDGFNELLRGETVAALSLSSSEDVAVERNGRLSGRAAWVAPITERGVAIVGARRDGEVAAFVVRLDAPGVTIEPVTTAALRGLVCGHVLFTDVAALPAGQTMPVMARVRILIAAVGLGIGRRALREALTAARAAGELTPTGYESSRRAAGEQTVQGLLADAATELDAAVMLTWKAATAKTLSLADASMAKLAATAAAQRAVERATQVVGAESFRSGHIIERLAQDVRALELFAGRTEALRAAVAEEELPHV
jgi:alkylation response protein AidB-like acyl-CoA dehydrogenase